MSKEWDLPAALDWVVGECWKQITNEKPQTEAFIFPEKLRPTDPPYSLILKAIEWLKMEKWIEFVYASSLSDKEGIPRSINKISFTGEGMWSIERQLEENPAQLPRYVLMLGG